MAKALASLRSTFGIADNETTTSGGFWESFDQTTTLSWTNVPHTLISRSQESSVQRFYGFVVSAGLGFLFCFIVRASSVKLLLIMCIGNVLCLVPWKICYFLHPWHPLLHRQVTSTLHSPFSRFCSTFFLMGPWNQVHLHLCSSDSQYRFM